MTDPCPHTEVEHHIANICEVMIHYPSEDYPCVCTGFTAGESAAMCGQCGHARSKHVNVRMCRPASGDFCPCRRVIA